MDEDARENDFGKGVIERFLEIYITPEIERRQQSGELNKLLDLRAAQIIFSPDGKIPEIRINEQVKASATYKLKDGISKQPGDPILESEVKALENFKLTEQDDPDCGHVTIMRIGKKWTIVFDFRYNKSLSRRYIETATQFFSSAEFSFRKKDWSAFIDSLYSSSELLAKSLLLSMADPKFRKKSNHKAIRSRFNRFVKAGNFKPDYRGTLNKLTDLRGSPDI